MENKISITIKNKIAEMGSVVQIFDRFRAFHNLPERVANALQVALDEMISNIILYAYEDEEEHEIQIELMLTEEAAILEIRDDGRAFNPFSFTRAKADTQSSVTERPIGGLGLHLVTSLMDACEYHYRDRYNCSIMKKNFNETKNENKPKSKE